MTMKKRKRGRPPKNKQKKETPPDYNVIHDEYLVQMMKQRNLQPSTIQGYHSTVKLYLHVTGFECVKDFLDEAEKEEQERVPLKESKLKQHLLDYRGYLLEHFDNDNTTKTYMAKLITIYNHYEIRVPTLPKLKIHKNYQVSYFDLPNKKHIKKALRLADKPIQALILFQSSSGTAKAETLSITIDMFLKGLKEYTDETDPTEIVEDLLERRDLVPILYLRRIKTDKYYYTCCSPEATHHILEYLHYRLNTPTRKLPSKEIIKDTSTDKVFPMAGSYIMKKFQIINDKAGFGFVGPYRFFRTHTLRKFHASNLGTSAEIIDSLEGRSKNSVHETYIKTKPDELRKTYMEHMHNVMINTKDYIGPHLGGKDETEKLKNSIVELVPDLVPTLEAVGRVQQSVVEAQQQQPQVQMLQQAPFDYNILKDIARLEARMDAIEERIRKLE